MQSLPTNNRDPVIDDKQKYGVTFVTDQDVRVYTDTRSKSMISLEGFLAIFEDIKFICQMIGELLKNLFRSKETKNRYNHVNGDASDKNQVFAIPGLGDPGIWGHMLKNKLGKETDVCVIQNKKNGNQPVKDTYTSILNLVKKYCDANPGKPIVLTGVSLGGRLAHKIEVALRESHPSTPVLVYAMAPAFASKFATDMDKHAPCLTKAVLHGSLIKCFKVGSDSTDTLITSINAPITDTIAPRTIVDVKASNDSMINDGNAFGVINNQEKLTYIRKEAHSCSHLGVISVAMDDLANDISHYFPPRPADS